MEVNRSRKEFPPPSARKKKMVHTCYSAALKGLEGRIVTVEANSTPASDPKLEIIGLPDTAVRESISRVKSAARVMGVKLLSGSVTVNLAPADIRKEGTVYDLPILFSLLRPEELDRADITRSVFLGELSLSGILRPVPGVLPMALAAAQNGFKCLYVPEENAAEASAAPGISVFPVHDVRQLLDHLHHTKLIEPLVFDDTAFERATLSGVADFSEVKGQETAKKALELAAAGMHNVMLIGPPGSGKSMLAARLPSILPPLTFDEALETSEVYSVAGLGSELNPLIATRPFRSPHHTISATALVGGGTKVQPGEISLAHNGVLFLDEFPEFDPKSRETMRQPLEEHHITITRVSGSATFPCSFMLIAAMNPCPCGYFGHPSRPCVCSPKAKQNYLSRVSGPVLDRIDIQVEVGALNFSDLDTAIASEPSSVIRARVEKAQEFAKSRFAGETLRTGAPLLFNAHMEPQHLEKYCVLTPDARSLLGAAFDRLGLSARGYTRLLKVARTVADFESSDLIGKQHVATAIRMRSLDRKYFGAQ